MVVILFGGAFCFVLRPKSQEYQLIGDAYVQGAMTGEFVQNLSDHNAMEAEEFVLC